MWKRIAVITWVFLVTFFDLVASCPRGCTCDLDDFRRQRIMCELGGTSIPEDIPSSFSSYDFDVEVLMITGSDEGIPNTFNLNPGHFSGLKRLKELHLSFSKMEFMGQKPFLHLNNTLQVLNLTHNSIKSVNEASFRNLTRLTHLYLDYNRIQSMPSILAFSALTSLHTLTLSHNEIDDISHSPGFGLAPLNVEVLDLSHNPLGAPEFKDHDPALPDYFFQDFPKLKTLILSNASITEFPWQAVKIYNPQLLDLDLSYNQLQYIENNQLDSASLRNVSLRGNPLVSIAAGAFQGPKFQQVDLGATPKQIFSRTLFAGAQIENLILSDTQMFDNLRELLEPLAGSLTGLDISGNLGLRIESRMFEDLTSLRNLSLSRMNIVDLSADMFQHSNSIEALDLSQNRLASLPAATLYSLKSLLRLDLSENYLRTIPLSILLPKIEEIDLSFNRLQSFPKELAAAFSTSGSSLRTLNLEGNPWICDCGVAELGRWLESLQRKPGSRITCDDGNNSSCPACSHPSELRGTLLSALPKTFLDDCPVFDTTTVDDNDLFKCYTCKDEDSTAGCMNYKDMTPITCGSTPGLILSCLKTVDEMGIRRECGIPGDDSKDSCEDNLGLFRNHSLCVCRTNLCNEAEFGKPAVHTVWFFLVALVLTAK